MTTTLVDRIYGVLVAEHDFACGPLDAGGTYPATTDEASLTTFELDCRDWGFVYGVAYGVARGEDPFESDASVAQRALEAARDAYTRWGGDDVFTGVAFLKDRARRPVPCEAVA